MFPLVIIVHPTFPVRTVKEFVAPGELADIIGRNGLQNVTWRRLAGGIITLHRGIKRPGDG